MLGNLSFGDYFKKGRFIQFAWELLTKVSQMPTEKKTEKCWTTSKRPTDEATDLWTKVIACRTKERACAIGRISRAARSTRADNFWPMADTGPCGPCSAKISTTTGPGIRAVPPGSADARWHRYIAIWTSSSVPDTATTRASMTPLPQALRGHRHGPGAGAAVLRTCTRNDEIDLFQDR